MALPLCPEHVLPPSCPVLGEEEEGWPRADRWGAAWCPVSPPAVQVTAFRISSDCLLPNFDPAPREETGWTRMNTGLRTLEGKQEKEVTKER